MHFMYCLHLQAQVLEVKGDCCNFPSVGNLYGLAASTVKPPRKNKYWAKRPINNGPGTGPSYHDLAVLGNPLPPPVGEPVSIGVNIQLAQAVVMFTEFSM